MNAVTEKQMSYINDLKEKNQSTKFLIGIVPVYEKIASKKGAYPEQVFQDTPVLNIGSNSEMVYLPANGALKPSDVVEMKKSFDTHVMGFVPETAADASTLIELLTGNWGVSAKQFVFDWISDNYTITDIPSNYGGYKHEISR